MEKTMARAIYKAMEIGKAYTSSELFDLLGDDYYKYIPVCLQGKDVRKIVASEMWKVVNTGFAKTEVKEETYHMIRGLRYKCRNRDWSKVSTKTYAVRYWTRIK